MQKLLSTNQIDQTNLLEAVKRLNDDFLEQNRLIVSNLRFFETHEKALHKRIRDLEKKVENLTAILKKQAKPASPQK